MKISACRVLAPAKINLGLDVLRRREDGYHELRMIMQSISVWDTLDLRITEEPGIRATCSEPSLAMDEKNLVIRAAVLLKEEFHIPGGLKIHLDKKIPMAAGLAGGSTDAAAALIGLNRLWELHLSDEELAKRGLKLGADIPFCLMGGTALAEGIGEKLTRLEPAPEAAVVLVKPPVDVSTAFVYGNLRASELKEHPDIDGQMDAIRRRDLAGMCEKCGNVLETVTVPACPVIREIKETMLQTGALVSMMSGSGPTVFGLYRGKEDAGGAVRILQNIYPDASVLAAEFTDGIRTETYTGEQ